MLPLRPGDECQRMARSPHRARLTQMKDTEFLRRALERRQQGSLWGQTRFFTPRLLATIFGDGRKLVWFSSINVRPAYWIVRIDSGWKTSNTDASSAPGPAQWHDPVCDAIEEEFGRGEKDDGELYSSARFPQACRLGDGTFWGDLDPSVLVRPPGCERRWVSNAEWARSRKVGKVTEGR
jgi:hypothetical protein